MARAVCLLSGGLDSATCLALARRHGYACYALSFDYGQRHMADLATKAGVEGRTRLQIHTPLLRLSKAGIVKLGHELGVPFGLTHSCYDPCAGGRPCGQCDACLLRGKGFREAGIEDR